MEQSHGRPATRIEVEAMTAIANLQDENRELRQEIQSLKRNQCRLAEVCQNLVDYTIGLFWSEKTPGIEGVAEIAEARAAIAQVKINPSPASHSHASGGEK